MTCCCRYNRTGRCHNCSCVKKGLQCQGCLPQRLGNCTNATLTQPSNLMPTTATSPPSYSAPNIASTSPPSQNSTPEVITVEHDTTQSNSIDDNSEESPVTELPPCVSMAKPAFSWGLLSSEEFTQSLNSAYSEAIHWKPNYFKIPYGNVGKAFTSELAKLYEAYGLSSAMEPIALKAATLMPILLLQKPARNSKATDHSTCLKRPLQSWKNGDLDDLVREGLTIQQRIPAFSTAKHHERLARSFANLMFQGKTKAAIRLLSDCDKGGVLGLNDEVDTGCGPKKVRDILTDKHPPYRPASPDAILNDEIPELHNVVFDSLDSKRIKSAALRTSGAAGPSGLDALAWRRLCTSHKAASNELCNALALVAKRLCTTLIDPQGIAPLTACRLIALDKNPGVRPIDIGDTARRIIAKATLSVIRVDVQEAAGSMQLCAGQISGTEAAVHAVRALYESDETEAILLIDASNVFNSLNRQAALHNIQRLCPALATILINTYRAPNELYIDGDVILSQEGTTQGDPLAMSMYTVATLPLIMSLKSEMNDVDQVWYADDASVAGKIMRLREWWEKLTIQGPKYGYFPNAIKTWLVTKEKHHSEATAVFNDTEVKVTSEGRPYLGAALGTKEYTHSYVSSKVQEWSTELLALNNVSKTQPHAAYAAFTHAWPIK